MKRAEFDAVVRDLRPRTALVLGSGLASVLPAFVPWAELPFSQVPGLADPTVPGHVGKVACGHLAGHPVLIFFGRLHYYEGHSWKRVGRPVEFAAECGVSQLVLTNAAGGIHVALNPGDLMLIRDHFSWQRPNAWRDLHRRPAPYDPAIIALIQAFAGEAGDFLHTGVYAAVTGPCYETPAEIRAIRAAGADAVGMSTAHEVETGSRIGLKCAAISCITNKAAGLSSSPLHHEEVMQEAHKAAARLGLLLTKCIARLH